jgi:hypothetical protein
MGVLTDIIIADETEAESIGKANVPCESWSGMDAKGIDQIKLGMLLSIVSHQPYITDLINEFTLLHEESDDGPWIYIIPQRLVSALAVLNDETLEQVAKEWSEIEEFNRWKKNDVAVILNEICALAKNALIQKKALLMWMSL